ncbi:hypothetical protein LTR37_009512 [Vermiconidia calcicola]|uniref:Uncharacterized protein n=1 Tax=Vermiconidia calcicola TaxID=1690605 RepID=A0ACC3N8L9_9PEZI|nr:hypothetical protein LTR37_009512 [Vermiconidia calcicola]
MDDLTQGVNTPSSIEGLFDEYTDEDDAPVVNPLSMMARSSKPRKSAGAKQKRGLGESNIIKDDAGTVRKKRQRRAEPAHGGGIQPGTFLGRRVEDRMTGSSPLNEHPLKNLVEEAIVTHQKLEKAPGAGDLVNDNEAGDLKQELRSYLRALKRLSKDMPTPAQIAQLDAAKAKGQHYIGRTASLTAGKKFKKTKPSSNGHTTQHLMMPGADTRCDQATHDELTDLTQGELIYMIGQHLKWMDMKGDELLSYSKDPLFLVVHALNRHHEGQGGVSIHIVDRRTAKDIHGKPAAFYAALELYETFKVPLWEGWSDFCRTKLRARKFTQEILSHGTVKLEDSRFQEVTIQTLIDEGLYDIFPDFFVPDERERAGLYTGQVVSRRVGYRSAPGNVTAALQKHIYSYYRCSSPVACTIELLEKVQKFTRHFMNVPPDRSRDTIEPHLHVFLWFLTLHKRLGRDPIFLAWIRQHYKASDVIDLYDDGSGGVQPGFTHVASNLPGVMQYIDLIRDCCFAFGLADLPDTAVEERNTLTGERYADEDARLQKNETSWRKYDADDQARSRDKAKKARRSKLANKTGTAFIEERAAGASDSMGVQNGSTDDVTQLRDEVGASGTGVMLGAGSREASNDGTMDAVAPAEGHHRGTAAVSGASMLERLLARA